jgi:hypothetical protein
LNLGELLREVVACWSDASRLTTSRIPELFEPAQSMTTPVSFPALCVPRDFGVYVVRDLSELRTCRSKLYTRYRHFDGLRVFDFDGKAFMVTAAPVSAPTSALGRFVARLFDLTLTVDLELSPIGPASLSEVRSVVEKAIDVDAESFEELSGRSVPWWRATLANAPSVKAVILAFQESAKEASP